MTEREQKAVFALGSHVADIITDVLMLPQGTAYARREITIGEQNVNVTLFVVRDKETADLFDYAAATVYDVKNVQGSESNKPQ